MSWSSVEEKEVGNAILGSWPGTVSQWGREGFAAYLGELQARGLTAEAALVAIRSWPGGDFPPSAPNLAAAARKDPSAPTFIEAYQLIYGKGGVLRARPKYTGPGSITDKLCNEAALKRAEELHPLVAAFVNRYGLQRLRMLPVDDPDFGELRRKELSGEWDQFCEAMEGRDVAALVSGRRGEIGRFDPLSALGVKRPQIEETAATGEGS